MRVIPLMAALATVLAACGGGEKKTSEQQGAPAAAPAATGATHDVNMVLDGGKYKYDPAELTIKSGDVVQFHNKSGGPHNVSFWSDSIPSGAADALKAGMPDQMSPLQSNLLTEQDAVYKVSFANAAKGDYKFYCLPHLALGMTGKITVQ
jgi:plastocyanin